MTLNDMSNTLADKVAVHLNLPFELEELRDFNSITAQIMVQIVDMTDNAIMQEIIDYAKENKICDVYLLDKSFVKNALEKQISKKPEEIISSEFEIKHKCPNCNKTLMRVDKSNVQWGHIPKFCDNCGQALDWSDT